jgi:F0F1-type ATP synthase membrane subunit c/vacuolar-type H+-ATPase subunit K
MTSDNDIYRWIADVIVYRGFGPLIACLGIIGGTLSLLVFRRKSLRKKSCSIYFLYLALADLLCMICWIVHFVLPTYNIHLVTLSNFSCKIFVFTMYFAFDLANYILTVW